MGHGGDPTLNTVSELPPACMVTRDLNESRSVACSPPPLLPLPVPPASPVSWLKLEPVTLQDQDLSAKNLAAHISIVKRFHTEGLTVRHACYQSTDSLLPVECIQHDLAETNLTSAGWLAASLIRHDVPTLIACGAAGGGRFYPPDCLDTTTWSKWNPAPLLYVVAPRRNMSYCGWPHDAYSSGRYHSPRTACSADEAEYVRSYEAAMRYWCVQKGGGAKHWRWAVSLAAAYSGSTSPRPRGPCLPPLPVCCQRRWNLLLEAQRAMAASSNTCVRAVAYSHNEVQIRVARADIQALISVCDTETSCHSPPPAHVFASARNVSRLVSRHIPLLRLKINTRAAVHALEMGPSA